MRPQTMQGMEPMMTKELAKIQSALGLDISRDSITLFESRSGRTLTVANNAEALRTALASLDLQVPCWQSVR